jgi:hypothetical protein
MVFLFFSKVYDKDMNKVQKNKERREREKDAKDL